MGRIYEKPDTKKFLQYFENRGFTIHIIHTSGHADINTLKQMVEAIAIFSYDITERKLAEYALSVSEDKFKQIAEKSITGIYIIQDAKMVAMFGKEILYTKTGVEAIAACQNNPDIDLILMDIQIPKVDGFEATRQIRQFNKDITIIAQTAFDISNGKEKATEAGCNDYISKPINKTTLHELIKIHFNKS